MAGKTVVTTINQAHFKIKAHTDLHAEASLQSLWIEIPDFCHLQCSYCFASTCRNKPHHPKGILSLEEYKKLLDDFKNNGGRFLGIPGNGEPFHPKNRELALEILRRANELGLTTTVFTTGDALFYKMESESYAQNIAAGPDFELMDELEKYDVILLIKCNSLQEKVQDKLVGQKGYTKARMQAINWLMEKYRLHEQERLGIVTSIMAENRDEILDIFDYARRNNLIFDCDTILPRGRGEKFSKKDSLKANDYEKIYRMLDKASGGTLSSGGSYVGVACDRVKHHLYVDIKGRVFPCIGCVEKDEERKLCLGTIKGKKQTLIDSWNNPIRKQLRDELGEIVFGPCSWCENFQTSCWSCLGRQVEHFEYVNHKLYLHTKGCFSHKPDIAKWVYQINSQLRKWLINIPYDVRGAVYKSVNVFDLEAFWQSTPPFIENASRPQKHQFPPQVLKDFSSNSISLPDKDVWRLVMKGPMALVKGNEPLDEDRYTESYREFLQMLIPCVLIPSLQVSFGANRPKFDEERQTLVQFCNLMFYMPSKKRYFYRTIAFNNLDPGIGSEPGSPSLAEINNRKIRLLQRWAESFSDSEKALILSHIKNLSHILETKDIYSYELLLSDNTEYETKLDIDREIQFYNRNILNIAPIIESKLIQDKVSKLLSILDEVSTSRWGEIGEDISETVFAYADSQNHKLNNLKQIYDEMAEIAFFKADEIADNSEEIIEVLKKILFLNTLPFSCSSSMMNENIDWEELFSLTLSANRRLNKFKSVLPLWLKSYIDVSEEAATAKRFYNVVLPHFFKLFISDSQLSLDHHKALNYFVWLGCVKAVLGVDDYFVLHAPNIQRQSQAFLDGSKGPGDFYPSGMIICSKGRLKIDFRDHLSLIFSMIMDPLSEIVHAVTAKTAGKREGQDLILHTINTKLGFVMAGLEMAIERHPEDSKLTNLSDLIERISLKVKTFVGLAKNQLPNFTVLSGSELIHRFNSILANITEEICRFNVNGYAFEDITSKVEEGYHYKVDFELLNALLFEVVWNVYSHSSREPKARITLKTNMSSSELLFTITCQAKPIQFMKLREGELDSDKGIPRFSGLALVESIQKYLGCNYWSARIIDKENKIVEFDYPFGLISEER